MTAIRVADMRYPVTTLGPGVRLAVWLQGCHIGCGGCISQDTWDPKVVPLEEVTDVVERAAGMVVGTLDGITISGGEPFEQPAALSELIDGLRHALALPSGEVDILCYSGFPLGKLQRQFPDVLTRLDAVIPNPFRADLPTDLPWRGSANQPLVTLSALGAARYGPISRPSRSIQVEVANGTVTMIGIPRRNDLDRIETQLAAAGIRLKDPTWRP